jgi:hypothetical protein
VVTAASWRTFRHDGKLVGVHAHPLSLHLPSRTKLQCTLQLRGQIHSPYFFFDLKKAFDVCSHDILLMKLSKMGITGTALNWFKSYLSDRTQVVDINGCR